MLWIALGALPVAVAVLVLGLRGRRIDDRPYCRACSFDLSGLVDPATCPECGRGLDNTGAIGIGRRRARPKIATIGAILALVLLGVLGADIWGRATSFNWNTIKPEWWLTAEARGEPTTDWAASSALAELTRRLKDGKLSREGAGRLVERALAQQADPAALWSRQWSDLIEGAWDMDLLSPAQLARYGRSYPALSITARPKVRQGAIWRPMLHFGPARLGPQARFQLAIRLESLDAGGAPLDGFSFGAGSTSLNELNGSAMDFPGRIPMEPGRYQMRLRFHFEVRGDGSAASGSQMLTSWDEDLTAPLEVVPTGTSTVQLFQDESLRAGIERAIHSKDLRISRTSGGSGAPLTAQGMLDVGTLPTPMACRILWRYKDGDGSLKEIPFQSTSIWPRRSMGYGGNLPPSFSATQVDIILRPDIEAAEMTEDITRLWGGEIVIPDQPVTWPDNPRP